MRQSVPWQRSDDRPPSEEHAAEASRTYVAAGGEESVQRVITAVYAVTKKLDQWYARQFADLDLTQGEWAVLAALAKAGDTCLTPSQLADLSNVAPSSMTHRLDKMAGRGLLQRRPDESNRTRTLVSLTTRRVGAVQRRRSASPTPSRATPCAGCPTRSGSSWPASSRSSSPASTTWTDLSPCAAPDGRSVPTWPPSPSSPAPPRAWACTPRSSSPAAATPSSRRCATRPAPPPYRRGAPTGRRRARRPRPRRHRPRGRPRLRRRRARRPRPHRRPRQQRRPGRRRDGRAAEPRRGPRPARGQLPRARRADQARPARHARGGVGTVLTVTSVGGAVGQPFADAYCGAKFAVEGFMQSLRRRRCSPTASRSPSSSPPPSRATSSPTPSRRRRPRRPVRRGPVCRPASRPTSPGPPAGLRQRAVARGRIGRRSHRRRRRQTSTDYRFRRWQTSRGVLSATRRAVPCGRHLTAAACLARATLRAVTPGSDAAPNSRRGRLPVTYRRPVPTIGDPSSAAERAEAPDAWALRDDLASLEPGRRRAPRHPPVPTRPGAGGRAHRGAHGRPPRARRSGTASRGASSSSPRRPPGTPPR